MNKHYAFGGLAQLARALGSYPIGRWFKSVSRYQQFGPMVNRLRHRPFTAKWAVQLCLGSPQKTLQTQGFLFVLKNYIFASFYMVFLLFLPCLLFCKVSPCSLIIFERLSVCDKGSFKTLPVFLIFKLNYFSFQ